MSRNYKFYNPSGIYFVSFATVFWVDVFTRQLYFEILAESVEYCGQEKGMQLFAYCFMPSHVHLIFSSTLQNPSGLIRDFKRHTSKKIIEAIEANPRESRKEWMLEMFKRAALKKANVTTCQFWQHHNKPIELWSPKVIKQKLDYIHRNPVESGFVISPEDWKYSSASNYAGEVGVLEIDTIGF